MKGFLPPSPASRSTWVQGVTWGLLLASPLAQGLSLERSDLGLSWARSDDAITLGNATARTQVNTGPVRTDLELGLKLYDLEYVQLNPGEIQYATGAAHTREDLSESQGRALVTLNYALNPSWELIGGGSYAQGYNDFREVWLAEYYRQKFEGFTAFAPLVYREPDPWALRGHAAARWTYNGIDSLELGGNVGHERIAPSYLIELTPEGDTELLIGDDTLESYGAHLTWVQAPAAWMRWRHTLSCSFAEDRDPRLMWGLDALFSLRDSTALQLSGGYTHEEPDFRAGFAQLNLEQELSAVFSVYALIRAYTDTGERIEDQVNAPSAPGLEVLSGGLGVRARWESGWSAHLGWVLSTADYDARDDIALDSFANLFADRVWNLATLAVGYTY